MPGEVLSIYIWLKYEPDNKKSTNKTVRLCFLKCEKCLVRSCPYLVSKLDFLRASKSTAHDSRHNEIWSLTRNTRFWLGEPYCTHTRETSGSHFVKGCLGRVTSYSLHTPTYCHASPRDPSLSFPHKGS